jgi:hypothetical protein
MSRASGRPTDLLTGDAITAGSSSPPLAPTEQTRIEMKDYKEAARNEVDEIKFLIHDLRVEKFINEVIHFHVTLNTDLEIYNVDQAQILHGEDLQELKRMAVQKRKTLQAYSNAVKSFSPDRAIVKCGKEYVQSIFDTCELVLSPHWGRVDRVLSFLPEDSRSVRARNHYRNCIHWLCGVHYRIDNFLYELEDKGVYEEFDVAEEIRDFVRYVIRGYVVEKSNARVEIQLERLDPAVIGGNRPRFRRMFFNLVMNAVDAMIGRKVGVLTITTTLEGEQIVLRVRDTGMGMAEEKIRQLLDTRRPQEGELHSLGFVFVRQTVSELRGDVRIESEQGRGTLIEISLPHLPEGVATPRKRARCEELLSEWDHEEVEEAPAPAEVEVHAPPSEAGTSAASGTKAETDWRRSCGEIVYTDYLMSDADFPGSIFTLAVTEGNEVDFFAHKPYERHWNITHEDLSPMFYQAAVRGRIEEDEEKIAVLILKAPQDADEYFELRNLPVDQRDKGTFVRMVHDEYIRVARKLIDTGLSAEIGVQLTGLPKFFPDATELSDDRPFALEALARQPLSSE